jgi:phosphate-selective porin OprO/OprP
MLNSKTVCSLLTTTIVVAASLGSEATAAQSPDPTARIDEIETQIRQLQQELQRVRGQLSRRDDAVKAAEERARQAQAEAEAARAVAQQNEQATRQAKDMAQQAQAESPKLSFPNGRPTLSSADGKASLAIGAQFHFDAGGYFQYRPPGTDSRQVKQLNNGVNLRRARLYFVGKLGDFQLNITPDFGGSPDGVNNSQYLYEASLNYTGINQTTATIGYFQPWLTLNSSQSSNDFLFLERPSIVEIARNLAAGNARASVGAKANGDRWFTAAYLTGPQFGSQNANLLSGEQTGGTLRVAGRPYTDEDWNVHLGVSGSVVFQPNTASTAGLGRRTIQLRDRPELRIDQNRLIDTGAIPASGAYEVGPEIAVQWRNLLVQGEYIHINVDQNRPAAPSPQLGFDGGYVEASWVLTGERRPYLIARAAFSSPKPDHPFDLSTGGAGAFELVGRYSSVDLNSNVHQGTPQSVTGGVFGGKQEVYGIGLNWYPNQWIRFMLDFSHVDVNRLDPTGRIPIGQHFEEIALRSQAAF